MADFNFADGFNYSDLILMDKNSNPIVYEDIVRIDVDMADGRVQPYYDLSTMYGYILTRAAGESMYVVKTGIPYGFGGLAPGNHGTMQVVLQSFFDEHGVASGSDTVKHIVLLYTRKKLETGKTYSYDYLVNQEGE